ncbi:glycosyltransferase [Cellulomonas sp. NS3]|uniref:glycosyltransferase n=1 Tax=Cellulomonas sp. NS3 TaxID=2973977 RepID=UPI0021628680|nr:glycosyltransferase [Cellulomonas sp. NS3]
MSSPAARSRGPRASIVLYLAVAPWYRQACLDALHERHPSLRVFTGDRALDPTVRSGVDGLYVRRVTNMALLGRRVLVQVGSVGAAVAAAQTIVDLNPRSITAWTILAVRRASGRRTLVWGHLHARAGAHARSNALRRMMRRLAAGTVLYSYDSAADARRELPSQPVWVAPNSLYLRSQLGPAQGSKPQRSVLYVGRLVPEKRVDLLVEGFALSSLPDARYRLVVVGEGPEAERLRVLAAERGVAASVEFLGSVHDAGELRRLYAQALCSVSPGYAGLAVTQSLGFGVPIVVGSGEPHAPEIELDRFGGVRYFARGDATALARLLESMVRRSADVDAQRLAHPVKEWFSAEAMARGLSDALLDRPMRVGKDGWPDAATSDG